MNVSAVGLCIYFAAICITFQLLCYKLPQTQQPKTVHIHYLTVSVVQEHGML